MLYPLLASTVLNIYDNIQISSQKYNSSSDAIPEITQVTWTRAMSRDNGECDSMSHISVFEYVITGFDEIYDIQTIFQILISTLYNANRTTVLMPWNFSLQKSFCETR